MVECFARADIFDKNGRKGTQLYGLGTLRKQKSFL